MKEIIVCKQDTKFFSIKNTSRIMAVYKIPKEKLPEGCKVDPLFGKIMPDESKDITITYLSDK